MLRSKRIIWLSLIAIAVILDQLSKLWIVQRLQLGQSIDLLPFLNFRLSHNVGIAFGMLGQAGPYLLVAVTSCVTAGLIVWLIKTPKQWIWQSVALSFIIGGAIGNLLDRISRGYVVDFIDFYIKEWHFHTFNIADSFITVGAVILIGVSFIYKKEDLS